MMSVNNAAAATVQSTDFCDLNLLNPCKVGNWGEKKGGKRWIKGLVLIKSTNLGCLHLLVPCP